MQASSEDGPLPHAEREETRLTERLRILLPDNYRDRFEDVQPVPMRSAGLVYREGRVAWDEIWGSFCDLAMAGGPPHRGSLLEPAARAEIEAAPARYAEVVSEICRGVHLVTGLYAEPASAPGWVQMYCPGATMTDWLARAITMENVSAHRRGLVLSLPAGPAFRFEKEIKNVITAVAKTTHYWVDHTSEERKDAMAAVFTAMNAEGVLLQPARQPAGTAEPRDVEALRGAVTAATGLVSVASSSALWVGFDCGAVPLAIATMRFLTVSNVLARRQETAVFVPVPAEASGAVADLTARFAKACRCARVAAGGAAE